MNLHLLKTIGVSTLFAMWLEFFYKFGATLDVDNFIGAIVIYTIYLTLLQAIILKTKLYERITLCLIIVGVIGLMAEWFLIGNAPWVNPEAFQLGMFVFHAVYPILGILMSQGDLYVVFTRRVKILFFVFFAICLFGFIIPHAGLRFAWFIWLPLLPYFVTFFSIVTRGYLK